MGACHVTSKAHTPFPEAPSDGWQAVEPEAEHEQDIGIEKVGDSLPFAVTSSAGKALAESDSGVPADAPADERSFLQKMADYIVSSRAEPVAELSPEEQFQASVEADASEGFVSDVAALATADAPPETENTSIQKDPIPEEPEAAAEVEPIWRTKIWSSETMIDEAMGAPAKAAEPEQESEPSFMANLMNYLSPHKAAERALEPEPETDVTSVTPSAAMARPWSPAA